MKSSRGTVVLFNRSSLIMGLIALILLTIITTYVLSSTFVYASQKQSVVLELDRTTAQKGEIIKVTVKVNNIKNLSGYQINIKYDPDILEMVNPNTGSKTSDGLIGNIITNSDFGILPVSSHNEDQGIFFIGRSYLYLEDYRAENMPEDTGILFEVGFKVLKEEMTSIEFTNINLPNAISGTVLFDWHGNVIDDYEVILPQRINYTALPTPEVSPKPDLGKREIIPQFDINTREAKSSIDYEDLEKAIKDSDLIEGIKTVVLDIKKVDGAKVYIQEIPVEMLSFDSVVHKIIIITEFGTIEVPSDFLNQEEFATGKFISFVIKSLNLDGFDDDLKSNIGNRPIVELDILIDGKKIHWKDNFKALKVSIPYTPSIEELQNHEHIVIWHIEDTLEKANSVTSGRYNADFGIVTFKVNYPGSFAVVYNYKTFDDIDSYPWAKKQIEVLASKGIINGTSKTTYSPSKDITRADFMILLIKSLDISSSFESNFDDVLPGAYYYQYVGIAKELGIASGVGDNKFNPLESITRQDMMVLTTNALKIANKVSLTGNEADISGYEDKDQISLYAVEGVATLVKKGIVVGSNNRINPLGNASRAELAAIIYKIYTEVT
ncbi:UNVERIFIED_CONTAM: S-layer family protein [Acetivibrio alkalicellulosi]